MSSLPPPVLLRDTDSAQGILTCTLCHELAIDEPVVTPCDHVFCRSCIFQALDHKKECPNDQQELYGHQLQPLSGILRRIWAQVGVQCPNRGCDWTGMAGNYANHGATCGQRQLLSLEQELQYKNRISELELEVIASQARIVELETEAIASQARILELEAANIYQPQPYLQNGFNLDVTGSQKEMTPVFQLGVEQGEMQQLAETQRVVQFDMTPKRVVDFFAVEPLRVIDSKF